MSARIPTPSDLERLLARSDFVTAVRAADAMLAQSRRNFAAWLGRGCANFNLGKLVDADSDLDAAQRLAPSDPQVQLLRGMVDQRLGRIDSAITRLRALIDSRAPQSTEAAITLCEVYWFAHRRDELAEFLAENGAWTADPRTALMRARIESRTDPARATESLLALASGTASPVLRRVAGFDAVGLLDKSGRYREAFDLATRLHTEFTPRFDLEGFLQAPREHAAKAAAGAKWVSARVEPVNGVALVIGLPRSGTTLLEQMLDRHPAISGIGEYEGIDTLGASLTSIGAWPRGVGFVDQAAALAMQQTYIAGARARARPGAPWTFDKTLRAWRWLPAIAAVMPGTVCLHVARDPRDAAISTFLSYFHPVTDGWTSSLASLRAVAEVERAVVPRALEVLALQHESIVYEQLVANPSAAVARVLTRMGLPMDAAVLEPQSNPRAVFTLSHEQVRRPINNASIGRWQNYAFAFDGSWDELAALHASRMAGHV
jgi:tetratricopeptide (TPR) repeat protein